MFGSYSIVFWNHLGAAQEVGFYRFHPSLEFFINITDIQWYTKGEVSLPPHEVYFCLDLKTARDVKEKEGIRPAPLHYFLLCINIFKLNYCPCVGAYISVFPRLSCWIQEKTRWTPQVLF